MATPPDADEASFLRLFEAFNARNWDVYDELLDSEVVVHEGEDERRGIDSFLQLNQDLTTAYPDATIVVDDVFTAGDRFAARINMVGTAADSTSDDELDLSGITHGRVVDGQITEIWLLTD